MSSFKRRGTAAASALPAGVRPSSFSSPVPLVSTGVPALDDILSGGGLSSASLFAIIPTTGTAALSASQIGASATTPAAQAESDHISRSAAEPYTELLLAYSLAQGIASKHTSLAIGEDVSGFASSIMARAGDVEDKELAKLQEAQASAQVEQPGDSPSERLGTVPDEDDESEETTPSAQREREMKIAWRYQNKSQFKTTVEDPGKAKDEAEAFCATFDLSRRISPRLLQKARSDGILTLVEIDEYASMETAFDAAEQNSFDTAFAQIQKIADGCIEARNRSPSSSPPVLRVCIRSLGSPAWQVRKGQRVEVEAIRFLTKLKGLLRSLALPSVSSVGTSTSAAPVAIPAIAMVTLSSYALSSIPSPLSGRAHSGANLVHRVSHVVDACISLSAFAPSPALRTAFPSYTGALKVLRTPSIGTLTNPSIRASVLRGMGAGSSDSGSAGEGGAGGGENNLAFKVRRKRLVIETLHLDIEGGVSERRTKPPKNADQGSSSNLKKPTSASFQRKASPATNTPTTQASPKQSQPVPAPATPPTASPAPAAPKFGGLKSLRERGLAVASARASPATLSPSSSPAVPLEVELDTRKQAPRRDSPPTQRRGPVFTSSRKEDYEF